MSRTGEAQPAALFPGGGEMGRRIAAYDWTSSPLGPIAQWPASLLQAVRLTLPARAQIVLFWGPQYVALYNDAYAPAIGANHPGALGRPAVEHWSELWDDLEPLLRTVRESGETVFAQARPFHVKRNGYPEEVFFDISYSPMLDDAGQVEGVLCVVSDQTERVLAERRQMEEQARLAQMFDQAPSFMALLREPGHVFELTNAAYQQLIGHREVVGRSIHDALPEVVEQGFAELLDQVCASGEPFTGLAASVRLQRDPTGPIEERILDFIYQPIKDAAGRVTAIFVEGSDVTAHVRAQAQLVLSEESLRLATEAAEVGTWDLDTIADELTWTARTKAMFGISPDAAVSMADFQAGLHPADAAATAAAFASALDPAVRAVYDVEYRTIGKEDGRLRWVAAKGKGLFDESGRCVRAIGAAIDITARKAGEERMRLLAREVDHRANNLLSVVQSTVALSRADSVEGLKAVIGGRIQALASAHQLLSESRWTGADLRRLAHEELLAFSLGDAARVSAHGPEVALRPAAAQSIAMALHELATNAAKYGALSRSGGRIDLTWRLARQGRLVIRWTETGGPPVTPPTRRGLGTAILARAVAGPLGGETRLDWRPEGLVCELELPLASVEAEVAGAAVHA